MQSPDPSSPSSSESSELSPIDDVQVPREQQQNAAAARMQNHPSPSAKRRLPAGSAFGASYSARDAKTRRREEAPGARMMAGETASTNASGAGVSTGTSSAGWVKGEIGGRKDKEDLVDIQLAEQLRKEFGDPFLESSITSTS